jgi:VanZ family protein
MNARQFHCPDINPSPLHHSPIIHLVPRPIDANRTGVTLPPRTLLHHALKAAAWLALAGIVAMTLGPVGARPQVWLGHPDLDRFLAYLALSFIFALAYPQQRLKVACLVVLGAVALEAFQLLTPDRHGHLTDLGIKLAGAVIGLPAGAWTRGLLSQAARGLAG